MVHNNHVFHEAGCSGYILQDDLNEKHGFSKVAEYYGDREGCSNEFECEWIDCEAHEKGDDDLCWREDCHTECGEFECVIWHWYDDRAEWVEDSCNIEAVMMEFNGHDYYHPGNDAAQAFGFENLNEFQQQLPNQTEV